MNNFKTIIFFRLTLTAGLAFTAGCKERTPPAQPSETAAKLPMPPSRPSDDSSAPSTAAANPTNEDAVRESMRELDAKFDAEDQLAEIRRRTMVTPAPADFKPESADRKVRLRLILEKKKTRVGESPRFRLEMTNIGRKAIDYSETTSSIFVKDGGLAHSTTMRFYLMDSRKKRIELLPLAFPPPSGSPRKQRLEAPPKGLTEAEQEKWFDATNAMGRALATFKVKLLPGETLHSIGDDDSPLENFKTLHTQADFDKPGTYRIHVELDDRPTPLTESYINFSLKSGSTLEEVHKEQEDELRNALGPVSSNAATFEVAR